MNRILALITVLMVILMVGCSGVKEVTSQEVTELTTGVQEDTTVVAETGSITDTEVKETKEVFTQLVNLYIIVSPLYDIESQELSKAQLKAISNAAKVINSLGDMDGVENMDIEKIEKREDLIMLKENALKSVEELKAIAEAFKLV